MFRVESNMHVHMCLTNMQTSTVAVSYMHVIIYEGEKSMNMVSMNIDMRSSCKWYKVGNAN